MSFETKLNQLPSLLKRFLLAYLIVLAVGISVGLFYVTSTTKAKPSGIIERWNGSKVEKNEIPEQYEKSFQEMLMTTHNHILGFSFILLQVGFIFYFNSVVKSTLKTILLIEPFLSIILTFGSIWLMRFVSHYFVYLTIISASVLYSSIFVMIIISMYDLAIKKN